MSDFDGFWKELSKNATEILKMETAECIKEASKDVNNFLSEAREYIKTWTIQLAEGTLSKDEFNFLAEGRLRDLAEMKALTRAGMDVVKVDRIRSALVNLAIESIVKAT